MAIAELNFNPVTGSASIIHIADDLVIGQGNVIAINPVAEGFVAFFAGVEEVGGVKEECGAVRQVVVRQGAFFRIGAVAANGNSEKAWFAGVAAIIGIWQQIPKDVIGIGAGIVRVLEVFGIITGYHCSCIPGNAGGAGEGSVVNGGQTRPVLQGIGDLVIDFAVSSVNNAVIAAICFLVFCHDSIE